MLANQGSLACQGLVGTQDQLDLRDLREHQERQGYRDPVDLRVLLVRQVLQDLQDLLVHPVAQDRWVRPGQ